MLRLYMPQDEYWLASFEVIPPPQKKRWLFRGQQIGNSNSPLKTVVSTPGWRLSVMQNNEQIGIGVIFVRLQQNELRFFLSELFSTNTPKSAAYAQKERPMSDAANLDKRGREPGAGLNPDKKEARGGRGTGSDASAALTALGGGPGQQSSSITG